MKTAIIFLLTVVATIGTAKSQERITMKRTSSEPGIHIRVVDGSTNAYLPIQDAKVTFIMGKDTTTMISDRSGVATYGKRTTAPKVNIVITAPGYKVHTSTLESPKPGNTASRQVIMRKTQN